MATGRVLMKRLPSLMATFYYAEHVHITRTFNLINTSYFCKGQESESETVAVSQFGNVSQRHSIHILRYNRKVSSFMLNSRNPIKPTSMLGIQNIKCHFSHLYMNPKTFVLKNTFDHPRVIPTHNIHCSKKTIPPLPAKKKKNNN